MSEYELDLLRQRGLEARWAKARRGELVIEAPIGFIKTADQRLEKDPDLRAYFGASGTPIELTRFAGARHTPTGSVGRHPTAS